MNPLQIKYFLAVAGTNSISRAAEELFVSAPAISKQIAALEDELGTALFRRSSRGMELSRDGEMFFEFFSRAGAEFAGLVRKAGAGESGSRGFVMGVMEDWCLYDRYRGLARRLEALPESVELKIHPLPPRELAEGLEDGSLDAALCISNALVSRAGQSSFRGVKLGEISTVLLYAPDAEAAPETREPADFADMPLYTVSGRFKDMAIEENCLTCNLYGFQPEVRCFDSLPEVVSAVGLGYGFTILDEWSAYGRMPGFAAVRLKKNHGVSLFWPERSHGYVTDEVAAMLQDALFGHD